MGWYWVCKRTCLVEELYSFQSFFFFFFFFFFFHFLPEEDPKLSGISYIFQGSIWCSTGLCVSLDRQELESEG